MSEEKKSFLSQRWVLVAIGAILVLSSVSVLACCGGIGIMRARHAQALKKAGLDAERSMENGNLQKIDPELLLEAETDRLRKLEGIRLPKIEQQLPLTLQDDGNGGPVEIRKSDSSIRELKPFKPKVPPMSPSDTNSPASTPEAPPKKS
jgi:hypothetical protein